MEMKGLYLRQARLRRTNGRKQQAGFEPYIANKQLEELKLARSEVLTLEEGEPQFHNPIWLEGSRGAVGAFLNEDENLGLFTHSSQLEEQSFAFLAMSARLIPKASSGCGALRTIRDSKVEVYHAESKLSSRLHRRLKGMYGYTTELCTEGWTGILYPVASSGRGFLPKTIRPQSADHTVTVANPGGFPPRPVLVAAYPHPHQVRPFGDPHTQSVHLIRPTHLHNTLLGSTGGVMSGMVKGVPVSAQQKVAASQPSISDCNGYKDLRDRSRDDSIATVSDRKVRKHSCSFI
ncbi:hypothetical protein CsSME_00011859 [Camellia sinensis var. sinensis]